MCERSSQNGPWRFECSNITSKNVIYFVHVLVKRSNAFKNPFSLFSSLYKFWRILVGVEQGPHDPHLSTLPNRLQRHMPYLREIWKLYQKKIPKNFKNPKKFWKSEKNWNCRCQNFENIDLIILPNRSNRSKKSLNRLDRFIGQRINSAGTGKAGLGRK